MTSVASSHVDRCWEGASSSNCAIGDCTISQAKFVVPLGEPKASLCSREAPHAGDGTSHRPHARFHDFNEKDV